MYKNYTLYWLSRERVSYSKNHLFDFKNKPVYPRRPATLADPWFKLSASIYIFAVNKKEFCVAYSLNGFIGGSKGPLINFCEPHMIIWCINIYLYKSLVATRMEVKAASGPSSGSRPWPTVRGGPAQDVVVGSASWDFPDVKEYLGSATHTAYNLKVSSIIYYYILIN